MLEQIRLTNFKCFEALTLHCAPLTLLCGLNGVGKSSVIQALLLLRQSVRTGALSRSDRRLELDGDLAELGTGRDALYEDATSDILGFELHRADIPAPCALSFRVSPGEEGDSDQLPAIPSDVELLDAWFDAPPLGGDVIYVNAERVGPRKFYAHSETTALRRDLGVRGEYAMNYLSAHWTDTLPAKDPRVAGTRGRLVRDVVERWLGEISPGAHLHFEKIVAADALVAGFSFDRLGDIGTRRFRATNVGFGLSYAAPILAALLAPPGTLCLIENPEAHLHPRGQTRLAELAVCASLAGVQVIAETHSDHFLDGVRIAVRDGLAQPQCAAIHYFDRDQGKTRVTSPAIDTDGRLSTWPAGFFDQHEDNLARLLAPKA